MEIRVYVDLDTLLDTRLGLMRYEFKRNLEDIMSNRDYDDAYTHKHLAEIAEVPTSEWITKWNDRTSDVLTKSVHTKMLFGLTELILGSFGDLTELTMMDDVRIHINYGRYEMSEEVSDALTSAIRAFLGTGCDVVSINMKPEQITPKWLLDNKYDMVLMFEFAKWYQSNEEDIRRNNPLNSIQMVAPQLALANSPGDVKILDPELSKAQTENYERFLKLPKEDIFHAAQIALGSRCRVSFLPMSDYRPPRPE